MTDDKPLSLSVINKSLEAELRQGACPERKGGRCNWIQNRKADRGTGQATEPGKPPSQANHKNKGVFGGHEHSMVCWAWIKRKATVT